MFNSLSKFVGYLWSSGEESETNDDKSSETPDDLPPTSGKKEEKSFNGSITALYTGYGLVNNDVYFDFNVVQGGMLPKVGDRVHVLAERKHGAAGWKAVEVSSVDKWEDTQCAFDSNEETSLKEEHIENKGSTNEKTENIVGLVTKFEGDQGMINNVIPFNLQHTLSEYMPYRGDWVKAQAVYSAERGSKHAINIEPLRQKSFQGQVEKVLQGFGFISSTHVNSDVYFTFSALYEGYIPRRGDKVNVVAIEVSGTKSQWRAIRIEPTYQIDKQACLNRAEKLSRDSPSQQANWMDKLLQGKEGVQISGNADFSQMDLGQSRTITIWISNKGMKSQTLLSWKPFGGSGPCQFTVYPQHGMSNGGEPCIIQPDTALPTFIHCEAKNLGADKQLLVFQFKSFKIGLHTQVVVVDPSQHSLMSSTPYQRSHNLSRQRAIQQGNSEAWVIQGQRPTRRTPNTRLPNRLPQYQIPSRLWDCVLNKQDIVAIEPELGETLTASNYVKRFDVLLHLEEIQQEIDIRDFDLPRTCLRPFGEYLALAVPGLAEGRPSVLVGDKIFLSLPGELEDGPQYEGYVHEILREEVLLKFHPDFHSSYTGEDYDVRFSFNR